MAAIHPKEDFDPEESCRGLHDSFKGLGTDEDTVIEILTCHNNDQRRDIAKAFQTMYGEELDERLKSELRSDLEDTCRGILKRPRIYDAHQLRLAMKGAGTDEAVLIEILCSRPPDEMDQVRVCYNQIFDRDLIDDLKSETSGNFERLLVAQATGGRDPSDDIDLERAAEDAKNLIEAGVGQWGTDEGEFMLVMSTRNYKQLRVTFEAYERATGTDIEDSIKDEMSGELQDGLLTLVKYAKDPDKMFAERLYKSMKGLGTDEETLKRIIISRSEIDMLPIRRSFRQLYDQGLPDFISDDVSGDFKRVLLRLMGTDDE